MSSDKVWIVSFDPQIGYDPLAEKPSESGQTAVREDFSKAPFGSSALMKIKPPKAPAPQGKSKYKKKGPPPAPKVPQINALKVRGLWRLNPNGAKVVNEILDRLRREPAYFNFTVKDPQGKEQTLSDEQLILFNRTTSEQGEFALPFELVLPLTDPVPFK